MLFALDQKKNLTEKLPQIWHISRSQLHSLKMGWTKVVAQSTHMWKNAWRTPPSPKQPLQPPVVGVWIAEKENGYGQTNRAFCRPTPWVWQKCMENTGGSTFQWPLKLPSESNSHQTTVHSKLVHWTPFRWLLCKSVQYWLIYRLMNAGPAYLVQKMNGFLWICLCGSAGPAFISL